MSCHFFEFILFVTRKNELSVSEEIMGFSAAWEERARWFALEITHVKEANIRLTRHNRSRVCCGKGSL